MFNFEKYNTSSRTIQVEVPELGPGATIECKFAGESNKPFYNAMLLLAGKRARRLKKGSQVTVDDVIKNRAEDAVLYPKHVFVGWEGVRDSDGNLVEYSPEVAKELCLQLCDQAPGIFDRIRDEAATEEFW